jgi:glycosyltransferase involved in cell wall biosynthesis
MPEPLISIIVPTYNRAHLLPATIRSLQAQKFRDFEIIIIDDGSTDNTELSIKPFLNDYTQYFKKINGERAAARNFGSRLSKGKYINFFDSDDLALPNHVGEAATMIKLFDEPEWFHLAFEWVTSDGSLIKKINQHYGEVLNDKMVMGNQLSCNGVFIRKDISRCYPFNEDPILTTAEDYELWLRLASRFPLFYSTKITSRIVDHNTRSVRTNKGKKLINSIHYFLTCIELDPAIKKYYGKKIALIYADAYSYIALHLSDHTRWKLTSTFYLFKSVRSSLSFVGNRRLFAIIRNLLFRWG